MTKNAMPPTLLAAICLLGLGVFVVPYLFVFLAPLGVVLYAALGPAGGVFTALLMLLGFASPLLVLALIFGLLTRRRWAPGLTRASAWAVLGLMAVSALISVAMAIVEPEAAYLVLMLGYGGGFVVAGAVYLLWCLRQRDVALWLESRGEAG